ncbi:DUF7683 domain-containing protein [Cytophaga aurantiaca]|uniref:DUF7683 domain-containing protein n=1 Tax=Cytophaga aurantiaca TaxID=29530 RepID=UPI0003803D5C|nr:hypothetical protein [Cytophaga aurantiaca]
MIEVDRHITFYEKYGDKLVGEILINEIELNDLLNLITESKYKDDHLLYDCYLLNKEQLDKIESILNKKIEYDLGKYAYFIEASSK